ncbi:MAG: UDP-4-amino-4,6-dideoxy-N-acetyl-beta-L-altrosamine transaminase [Candidatus Microgenomates bacterium]|jgi:UDP-4-amino-4,6-dideoxy-N-acetyl-beta-L-altrosamine transaminase/pseudaminic acid cytidylyltransferase
MNIPYGRQTISKSDIKAVVDTLNSEYLTTGPKIKEFEEKFAKLVNVKYAVAVSNGTAALHLACLAAGLKQGDELITSPMTFAASANCALYCGARPVFVDIKEENGLIDEKLIEKKITSKTKIVIPVHYGGLPCDMKKIKDIARKHKLVVIEDACHSLGSRYKGTKIGDCTYSDMAVFSFHPVKHITTGEGGMITTNSKEFYEKLLILRTHGITKDSGKLINQNEGSWYYEMQELGYNYRITDLQCALGISQLGRVNQFVEKRISIAKRYYEAFAGVNEIQVIKPDKGYKNAYHLYIVKVKDKETRLNLFNRLKENGIFCQVHYIPVYWHPYYQELGYKKGICPIAEEFYERIISIPIYPGLGYSEQQKVIGVITSFLKKRKILAIIPARGGSKRIPKKNVKKFLGKPIIAYSIETAIKSKLFDEVMVSTDNEEIAKVAKKYGAKVPFFRSKKNSEDYSTTASVIKEVLGRYENNSMVFDIFCCIYPTAPLITEGLLKKSFDLLIKGKFDSVIPVVRYSYPIQRAYRIVSQKIKMIQPGNMYKRSQDFPASYHDSGQFYWAWTDKFNKNEKVLEENFGTIIISDSSAQDIDTIEDWKMAELKYNNFIKSKFNISKWI